MDNIFDGVLRASSLTVGDAARRSVFGNVTDPLQVYGGSAVRDLFPPTTLKISTAAFAPTTSYPTSIVIGESARLSVFGTKTDPLQVYVGNTMKDLFPPTTVKLSTATFGPATSYPSSVMIGESARPSVFGTKTDPLQVYVGDTMKALFPPTTVKLSTAMFGPATRYPSSVMIGGSAMASDVTGSAYFAAPPPLAIGAYAFPGAPAQTPSPTREEESYDVGLAAALASLGQELPAMYKGARIRAQRGGYDSVRQAAVSARELAKAVLDELAPQRDAAAWFRAHRRKADPRLLDGKHPTWAGRVMFAFQSCNRGRDFGELVRSGPHDSPEWIDDAFRVLGKAVHAPPAAVLARDVRRRLDHLELVLWALLSAADFA